MFIYQQLDGAVHDVAQRRRVHPPHGQIQDVAVVAEVAHLQQCRVVSVAEDATALPRAAAAAAVTVATDSEVVQAHEQPTDNVRREARCAAAAAAEGTRLEVHEELRRSVFAHGAFSLAVQVAALQRVVHAAEHRHDHQRAQLISTSVAQREGHLERVQQVEQRRVERRRVVRPHLRINDVRAGGYRRCGAAAAAAAAGALQRLQQQLRPHPLHATLPLARRRPGPSRGTAPAPA
jgi:hypothetical protein